jgi:hypothetical protein
MRSDGRTDKANVVGANVPKNGFKIHGVGFVEWIRLAQDWVHWRALVNAVLNLLVPFKGGEFLDYLRKYLLLWNFSASWNQSLFSGYVF